MQGRRGGAPRENDIFVHLWETPSRAQETRLAHKNPGDTETPMALSRTQKNSHTKVLETP